MCSKLLGEHALTLGVLSGGGPESEHACSVNLPLQNRLKNIDADVMHAKSTAPLTAVSRPINYNLEKHSLAA